MSNELIKPLDRNQDKTKSAIVVQHNHLIEANFSLTLQEQRIILWLVSQVKSEDIDFKEHIIKVSDLCQYAGLKSKNMHKEIKNIAHNLLNNILHIQHSQNHWVKVAWLSSAEYLDGTIKLCFSPKLKPYLLELKECFTPLELSTLMRFKSTYALRLYELLKQYQKVGIREFSLVDLRNKLGITDEEYALYGHFKKKVISIAQKEINGKSDILIDIAEIKEGKRVSAIKFFIETQKTNNCDMLLRSAQEFGISKSAVDKFLKKYSKEEIFYGLNLMKNYTYQIKNPVQFLNKALAENWKTYAIEGSLNLKDSELNTEREVEGLSEPEKSKNIRKYFIKQLGEKEYKSWLRSAEIEIENNILKVKVRSTFLAQCIQTHYVHILKAADKNVEYVEVTVKTEQKAFPVEKDDDNKIESVSKNSTPRKRKGINPNKKTKREKKAELPKLKQLTFWGRVKSVLQKDSD